MKGFEAVNGTPASTRELARNFKDHLKVTDYEAFSLALKVEQNELLKQAFVISSTDAHPGALEKIAMSLGER